VNVIYSKGKGIFNNQVSSLGLREEEKNRLFQLIVVANNDIGFEPKDAS
jgi:hypothetical protein